MNDLKPTFDNLANFTTIYEDNELFTQFINEDLPKQSNANALLLKYSPTIEEFKLIEQLAIDLQASLDRDDIQFFWPENTGIRLAVLDYLQQHHYTLGKTLLMHAQPQDLKLTVNSHLTFEKITPRNFNLFTQMNAEENTLFGQAYVNQMETYYRYQFQSDQVTGLIAYDDHKLIGSVIMISSKNYLEVDNLLTVAEFRKQHVASSLLHEIQKMAKQVNKSLILKADAEDYPHEIYSRLGFHIIASQIAAKKSYKLPILSK